MSHWLVGHTTLLAEGAVKAVLMYLVALVGLRTVHRRTMSQWTAIDFAAAVAIGAVMGRTAIASGQSFVLGAVALVAFLLAHTVVIFLRFNPVMAKFTDRRVRVLVAHGRPRRRQLLICGITENDFMSQLRESGIGDVRELRYVLYETKGELTLVREDGSAGDPPIVAGGLQDAAGFS